MSGKPLDKYTDTTTPVSTSIQGCGMVEVKHEVYYPDDLGQRIPAANVPYRLQIPHGGNIFGTTDANGVLSFEGTGEGTFFCEYEPTLHIEKDQILNEIRTALDELLKVERDETAAITKKLDDQPLIFKAADYYMAYSRGFWKGIVGIVEFVGTVLWGAAKGLYHASKYLNPLTAPETFKQDMAALKETYQELKEFKDEDLETYLMLANDEETWKVFTKFSEDYVDAQHSLEWTEGGGETVFAIILIVVTAGAGAAGAAGSAGSRLAQLGQKLSGPIKRLTDVLKRARAKKKVKDKTNQRVESEAEIKHTDNSSIETSQSKNSTADKSDKTNGFNNTPKVLSGQGASVKMDGHKVYSSNHAPLSSNPSSQYRFSDPAYRSTGGDVYFGENIGTSYFEVRKNLNGKSLFVGDVKVDNILDLTDPDVVKKMNIDPTKLTSKVDNPAQQKAVYGYTNSISNQAYESGYNGILYPSSRKLGNNQAVILFDGRYDPNAIKVIIDKPIK